MLHTLLVVLSLQSSTGISVGHTTSLPIPQRICASTFTSNVTTRMLSPICSRVNTGSDFLNYGISYLEKFLIHSVQYDTDALIIILLY